MTTTAPEFGLSADEVGNGNKRALVAGGVVAALVLGAGGYFFLKGGSETESLAPVVHHSAAKVPTAPRKAGKPTVKKAALVPAVSTVKLGRDPFHELYTLPVKSDAPAAAAPGTSSGTTSTTTSTGAPVAGTGTTSGGTTATPYSLTLVSVTGTGQEAKVYTFKVGTVSKKVVAAQRFGKYGELVVLAWIENSKHVVTGALLQVGDDDPVAVRLAEKITVL